MNIITEHIGDLVGENKLTEAINYLRALLKNSPKLDEVLLQSGRLTEVMHQIRIGTIDNEEANRTKNKIRWGLLEFVRELDAISENNPELLKEPISNATPIKIKQNHTGSGDNVIGSKVVYNQNLKN